MRKRWSLAGTLALTLGLFAQPAYGQAVISPRDVPFRVGTTTGGLYFGVLDPIEYAVEEAPAIPMILAGSNVPEDKQNPERVRDVGSFTAVFCTPQGYRGLDGVAGAYVFEARRPNWIERRFASDDDTKLIEKFEERFDEIVQLQQGDTHWIARSDLMQYRQEDRSQFQLIWFPLNTVECAVEPNMPLVEQTQAGSNQR